jgi:hypothetical protein
LYKVLSISKYKSEDATATTDTNAATCIVDIKLDIDDIVFSCVEKSILPNANAMFKKVNNGPKPVNMVGIVCIILKLNFEVIRVSSLK